MGTVPAVECVLAPVDGSDASAAAVEYAVAVADAYDAGVHAVYVLDEGVSRAIESGEIEEAAVAGEIGGFLDDVRDRAGAAGAPVACSTAYGFSTRLKSRHPGSVVLDTAAEVDADFIVVPREPAPDDDGVLVKAAEYVLLYASQPVLSV